MHATEFSLYGPNLDQTLTTRGHPILSTHGGHIEKLPIVRKLCGLHSPHLGTRGSPSLWTTGLCKLSHSKGLVSLKYVVLERLKEQNMTHIDRHFTNLTPIQ